MLFVHQVMDKVTDVVLIQVLFNKLYTTKSHSVCFRSVEKAVRHCSTLFLLRKLTEPS